jgi:N-formylglutamate amidohydrolase
MVPKIVQKMKYPILITVPHCSNFVPAEIHKRLNLTDFELKHKTDPYTDQVFDVPNVYLVKAKYSRVISDPNGDPTDFDSNNIERNGVISLRPYHGKSVFKIPPTLAEVQKWTKKYHQPFHAKVEAHLPKVKFLIDGHSLFSECRRTNVPRQDIVISNQNYKTCSKSMTAKIAKFFEEQGFSVGINDPFLGRYIIQKYCAKKNPPGIQLEIKRSLYLNEKNLRPKKAGVIKMNKVIARLTDFLNQELSK